MSSIDDIISALRSNKKNEEDESAESSTISSDITISTSKSLLSATDEEQNAVATQDAQTQSRNHVLDFDLLGEVRKKKQCFVTVADVLESASFKVMLFVALMKTIQRYNDDVLVAELVDETGTIECSLQAHLEAKFGLKAGCVVVLRECSLWKLASVHINVVEENIDDDWD